MSASTGRMGGAVDALSGLVRDTIGEFRMLANVERLGVALSGGADSMALLHLLVRAPFRVTLVPIFVHQYPSQDRSRLEFFVRDNYGLELVTVTHDTVLAASKSLASGRAPCRACAPRRARALAIAAQEQGLDALALGHHLDDVAATLLLNMFHGGSIDTMRPVATRAKLDVPIIRPLYFAAEAIVKESSPTGSGGLFDCGMCSTHAIERERAQEWVSRTFQMHGEASTSSITTVLRNVIGA